MQRDPAGGDPVEQATGIAGGGRVRGIAQRDRLRERGV
jgi:hypothetical protein